MGKQATKKVVGHSDLLPGEQVLDAVWGAGANMMKVAKLVGPVNKSIKDDIKEVSGTGDGRAKAINSNGILALTDRRLLWCPVKTKVGKPEKLIGFEFDEVEGLRHEKPVLVVDFKDGSSSGIRADFMGRPGDFLKAFEEMHPKAAG